MPGRSWNRVCLIKDLCSETCTERATGSMSPNRVRDTAPRSRWRERAATSAWMESRRRLLLVHEALNDAAHNDRHRELVLLAPRLQALVLLLGKAHRHRS